MFELRLITEGSVSILEIFKDILLVWIDVIQHERQTLATQGSIRPFVSYSAL